MTFNARVLPTREQATVYYMTCTRPALQRWLKTWQYRLLEEPIMVSERQWHITYLKSLINAHTNRGTSRCRKVPTLSGPTPAG